MPAEHEARVVAVGAPGVGHVDEPIVLGEADRIVATGRDRPAPHERQGAVVVDPKHRDLVASGVHGEQVTPVARDLDGSLGGETAARPGAAGDERRSGDGRQRAVGVAIEPADRVRARGVVVGVDVPHDLVGRRGGRPGEAEGEAGGDSEHGNGAPYQRRHELPLFCFRVQGCVLKPTSENSGRLQVLLGGRWVHHWSGANTCCQRFRAR